MNVRGELVTLRAMGPDDASALWRWNHDPAVVRWMNAGYPQTEDRVRTWLTDRPRNDYGDVLFGVEVTAGGKLIGVVRLHGAEAETGCAELDIYLGEHLVDPVTAERIDRDFRPDKKTTWRPADVLTFPPQTLRRLATDPNPRMRCLAPRDVDLPVELAERLATDPESRVRRAVAEHPNLPVHVRRALLADPDEWVAHATATAPTLSVTEMDQLLTLAGI
ncbi:GNAT family N-acetyltransferase [Micromonospora matsumotoense]|uniref:GNAT family N-acetyltransferase n=1 Tax=Micromonospora matsumotoense TaxID=121616 RepID=UPI003412CAB3